MRLTWFARRAGAALALLGVGACGATERRFALRAPLAQDTDTQSVSVPCRNDPNEKDPKHISCAPEAYVSPVIWDGADNLVFRPLAESFAFEASHEATNANSLDEVADSAWFKNRIGVKPLTAEEIKRGACDPSKMIDAESVQDGAWVIDKGKPNGSSPGFRVVIPKKGKFMFKSDAPVPERPSAASVVGAAAYHAVGFNTSCEQVVYFKPSLLKLTPGLKFSGNFDGEKTFDQKALDVILAGASKRGPLIRVQASAWLQGRLIGPFRYEGTRDDDPNDVIPHQDRRELRGGRLLAAWLDHFDAREQNSMDAWMADRPGDVDSSPGHVVHYYLDTSDCLGSEWDWEEITRRLGYSYIVNWGDLAADFVTLGIPLRPWDKVKRVKGHEMFVYFNVDNFDPEAWENEYPNPAFSRMTERDGAWMARILARFTPESVRALAELSAFTDTSQVDYLATVLQGRLEKILERYLTRLSPVTDVRVEGSQLCGVDLVEWRGMRDAASFAYRARTKSAWLPVTRRPGGEVCVNLSHVAPDGGAADDAPERYVQIAVEDGIAKGPLVAHLYDLGPSRGFQLAGVERIDP
ncbi:MAG TPA: hypothetical protein VGI39_40380 [Polyangiaceae bacterium]|jgi:hypothetical protein